MIESINSSYNPPANGTGHHNSKNGGSISIKASGVDATCSGKYHSSWAGGDIKASLKDSLLAFSLQVTPDDNQYMPSTVSIKDCDSSLIVSHHHLHFAGSMSARFFNAFSWIIADYLSSRLSRNACPALEFELEDVGRQIFSNLNDSVAAITREGHPALYDPAKPEKSARETVQWELDAPLLRDVLIFLNSLMAKQPGIGARCGIDRVVAGIATHDSGGVSLDIADHSDLSWNISLPNNDSLHFDILQLNVSGLDSLDRMEFMNPDGVSSFTFGLESTNEINVTLGLMLGLYPREDSQLELLREVMNLNVSLRKTNFSSHMLLEMDRAGFDQLSLSLPWSSFAKAIVLASLSDVDTTVDVGAVHFTAGVEPEINDTRLLEDSFDRLVDIVLELLINEYSSLLTNTIRGIVHGPARHAINRVLQNLTTDALPSTTVAEPVLTRMRGFDMATYLKFDESPVIAMIGNFLERSEGMAAVNDMVSCGIDLYRANGGLQGVNFSSSWNEFDFSVEGISLNQMAQFDEISKY